MTIHQIAEALNEKAVSEGFRISELPELRKTYLGKKQLPSKIFTYQTIFDGENKYAFHHGGRDEIQFNIGEEQIETEVFTRYGLSFSLEASHSLPDPVKDLEPFRRRFDLCLESHPDFFMGFKMWHYRNGQRSDNFDVRKITDAIFQPKTFICIGRIINKPLSKISDEDITEILNGFDQLLPIYEFCVLQRPRLKIFTRLTSNENNWELPSPHKWRKEDQGKKNIPFESQYGFGHEEWLLNSRYNLGGFQYGFIRGIQNSSEHTKRFDEVYLYTVKNIRRKNFVYYLGLLKNVLVIKDIEEEQRIIQEVIDDLAPDMMSEIEAVNGDPIGMTKLPFQAIVKFKLKDVHFFDEPVHQPNFNLEKYKRFQPYKLECPIEEIFQSTVDFDSKFISGKSSQTIRFNRKNKESSVTIEKLHSEIVDALEDFLKPEYSLVAKNISIERTRFHGNIADVVTKDQGTKIEIYEVKTSSSGRRNIRDAIGQLLDYALHSKKLVVKKLIIVSPAKLNENDLCFLESLKAKIDFPLEYLCYTNNQSIKFFSQ